MLDSWNQSIFNDIKQRLQDSAMKLVRTERNGEVFDSQLVIGVRESYGTNYNEVLLLIVLFIKFNVFYLLYFSVNLCSNPTDRLEIYRENFQAAYIEATEAFYRVKATEYLSIHGVENYMRYADAKLREEELRAQKYLEPNSDSIKLLTECCVKVLVANFKSAILAECQRMIQQQETESKLLLITIINLFV